MQELIHKAKVDHANSKYYYSFIQGLTNGGFELGTRAQRQQNVASQIQNCGITGTLKNNLQYLAKLTTAHDPVNETVGQIGKAPLDTSAIDNAITGKLMKTLSKIVQ